MRDHGSSETTLDKETDEETVELAVKDPDKLDEELVDPDTVPVFDTDAETEY